MVKREDFAEGYEFLGQQLYSSRYVYDHKELLKVSISFNYRLGFLFYHNRFFFMNGRASESTTITVTAIPYHDHTLDDNPLRCSQITIEGKYLTLSLVLLRILTILSQTLLRSTTLLVSVFSQLPLQVCLMIVLM